MEGLVVAANRIDSLTPRRDGYDPLRRGVSVEVVAPMTEYVRKRGGAKPAPLSVRLWRKVRVGPDCWEWLGARNDDNYPVLWDGSRITYAHRIAYEMVIGPIPEGLAIDHTCNNRLCVNPAHLEPVTSAENNRRAVERRRARKAA